MSDLEIKKTPQEIRDNEILLLVQRQTGYTEDIAKEKLKLWNNNYINVIKEYMNPDFKLTEKKEPHKSSVNQIIYSEIRGFMDNVNKGYKQRKKNEEINKIRYENTIKLCNEKIKARVLFAKTKWPDAPDACWVSKDVVSLIMRYKCDDIEGVAGKTFYDYYFEPVKG